MGIQWLTFRSVFTRRLRSIRASELGVTVTELAVSIALIGVASVSSATIMRMIADSSLSDRMRLTSLNLRSDAIEVLSQRKLWNSALQSAGAAHPLVSGTTINSDLACIRDSTACVDTDHPLTIIDRNGRYLSDPARPSLGVTANGAPCTTFSTTPSSNAQSCPLRLEASWKPRCPLAGPCLNPHVLVSLNVRSAVDSSGRPLITGQSLVSSVMVESPDGVPGPLDLVPSRAYTNATDVAGTHPVAVNILAYNPQAGGATFSLPSSATAKGGSVSISGSTVTYNPPPGYHGVDTFKIVGTRGTYNEEVEFVVNVMTPYTWIGNQAAAGSGNPSPVSGVNFPNFYNASNWCGEVVSGVCTGAALPRTAVAAGVMSTGDLELIFNGTCFGAHCGHVWLGYYTAGVDVLETYRIFVDSDFLGTIHQSAKLIVKKDIREGFRIRGGIWDSRYDVNGAAISLDIDSHPPVEISNNATFHAPSGTFKINLAYLRDGNDLDVTADPLLDNTGIYIDIPGARFDANGGTIGFAGKCSFYTQPTVKLNRIWLFNNASEYSMLLLKSDLQVKDLDVNTKGGMGNSYYGIGTWEVSTGYGGAALGLTRKVQIYGDLTVRGFDNNTPADYSDDIPVAAAGELTGILEFVGPGESRYITMGGKALLPHIRINKDVANSGFFHIVPIYAGAKAELSTIANLEVLQGFVPETSTVMVTSYWGLAAADQTHITLGPGQEFYNLSLGAYEECPISGVIIDSEITVRNDFYAGGLGADGISPPAWITCPTTRRSVGGPATGVIKVYGNVIGRGRGVNYRIAGSLLDARIKLVGPANRTITGVATAQLPRIEIATDATAETTLVGHPVFGAGLLLTSGKIIDTSTAVGFVASLYDYPSSNTDASTFPVVSISGATLENVEISARLKISGVFSARNLTLIGRDESADNLPPFTTYYDSKIIPADAATKIVLTGNFKTMGGAGGGLWHLASGWPGVANVIAIELTGSTNTTFDIDPSHVKHYHLIINKSAGSKATIVKSAPSSSTSGWPISYRSIRVKSGTLDVSNVTLHMSTCSCGLPAAQLDIDSGAFLKMTCSGILEPGGTSRIYNSGTIDGVDLAVNIVPSSNLVNSGTLNTVVCP